MAFVWRQNSDSRQPKYIGNLMAKASTTLTYGVSVRLVNGRWQPCAAAETVGGVYNGPTFTSGANDLIEVIEVRPGDEFTADYTGTPDATFLPGQSTADCDANGVNLNAADVTGGSWAILSLNTAKSQAVVRCKNRQLS